MRSAALCMAVSSLSGAGRRTLLLAGGGPFPRSREDAAVIRARRREGAAAGQGSVELARELRAQPQHRLGVQLRDARLGDAEHLADLAEGEVLVVVERDDELLALGEGGDRVRDPLAQ